LLQPRETRRYNASPFGDCPAERALLFRTTDDGTRMTTTLRDLLDDGKVHVLDGAMGTMLYSKGFFLNVCYDELNLKQPKLVQEVHEAYVRAGAEILETNTLGANPLKLGSFRLAEET